MTTSYAAHRRLDDAEARRLKQEALDGRKRAAFLVLDSDYGTMEKAAAAGRMDRRTLRKWIAERKP